MNCALQRLVVERLLAGESLVDRDADRVRILRLVRDRVGKIAERRVRRDVHRVGAEAQVHTRALDVADQRARGTGAEHARIAGHHADAEPLRHRERVGRRADAVVTGMGDRPAQLLDRVDRVRLLPERELRVLRRLRARVVLEPRVVLGEEGDEVVVVDGEVGHTRGARVANGRADEGGVAGTFDLFTDPSLAQHVVAEKRRLVTLVLDQLRVARVRVHDLEVHPGRSTADAAGGR
jgi:hypothetical protein